MGEPKPKQGELPLPSLFDRARKIHAMASESGADQVEVRKGCDLLRECDEMIGKLGLFSSNETKDDISTPNLKYLLVPFYLGELTEKIVNEDRILCLKLSQDRLKEFVTICEALELVPEEELENQMQHASDNALARRAKKIARFKRQRAVETKLQEIQERRERHGRSIRASAFSTPVGDQDEEEIDDDGEEEREVWLSTISLALCKAFDLLESLKKEEEMLVAIKEKQLQDGNEETSRASLDERTKKAESWHRDAALRSHYAKPAQPITCATFAQDVIEGRAKVSQAHDHKFQPAMFGPASLVNGSLTSERERMAAQVFQPGHRLPTMSIEEAGLTEMKMMKEWQESTAKYIDEVNNSSWHSDYRKPVDNDDDDDDEAATMKARAWDDWKDDNPRGAGNKKLTPTG